MEDVTPLLKEYYLQCETHKLNSEDHTEFYELITNDEFWTAFLDSYQSTETLKGFYDSLGPLDKAKHMKFGIACLSCFVQSNFTGPGLPRKVVEYLDQTKFSNDEVVNKLAMNAEEINPNTKYAILLAASEMVFDYCEVHEFINFWWSCRALMIHQEILDELSSSLLSSADRLNKLIQKFEDYVAPQTKAELYLEMAQLYLKFRHITKSKDYINSASQLLGISYSLVGKLGKRTRFQEQDIAQLTIQVSLEDKEGIVREGIANLPVPHNLCLNDDIRLDQIEFADKSDTVKLGNVEQKLFLTTVDQRLVATPPDELRAEELLPFINLILNQNNTFVVRFVAVILRSKLECKGRRSVERCMKQCEEVIECFHKLQPPAINRVGDVFGVSMSPIWKVQSLYAEILLNIGLVKTSLDIYLEIKLWEEVIVCYTILQQRQKAAEVIKEQLEKKPTVKMLCLLGDATDDVMCYEEAWNMSKKRSFRAQRHWGNYYFSKKNYEEAIPHFEKSLSINPLQTIIWLRLGFAALKVENWQTAATAYRRYTSLEPDNFEAWNNLAQAYIHINNKRSAHQALLEALKCNFHNWKVWENFMVVSCDVGQFPDVIRSYHRLLDLKPKYMNCGVLSLLVYNVKDEDDNGENGMPGRLLQKTRELLGRVTSVHPNCGYMWELYACLAPVLLKKAERLQKAYRGYTQIGWDKDPRTCKQVLNVCNKLADIVLDDEIDAKNPIVVSIKLNISSAFSAIKKHNYEETKDLFWEVMKKLNRIFEKIENNNVT